MLELVIGATLAVVGAGLAVFAVLIAINVALLVKLRSMFGRGVPFAGYLSFSPIGRAAIRRAAAGLVSAITIRPSLLFRGPSRERR